MFDVCVTVYSFALVVCAGKNGYQIPRTNLVIRDYHECLHNDFSDYPLMSSMYGDRMFVMYS